MLKITHMPILLAFLSSSTVALAADAISNEQFEERYSGQAVSEVNAKIEFGYIKSDFDDNGPAPFGPLGPIGLYDSSTGKYVQGAVSAPLGGQFGVQIDVGYMETSIDTTIPVPPFIDTDIESLGAGGHLFWRDPSVGLLGVYGHRVVHNGLLFFLPPGFDQDVTETRLAVEAEGYFDQLTVKGLIGADHLDVGIFGDEQYLVAKASADYYINENFMVSAGVDHAYESTSAKVGFEAMWDTGGASPTVYADASFSGDEQTVMAGVKIYLGNSSKSLMRRHREDDPGIDLFENFGALGSCLNNPASGGLRGPPPVGAPSAPLALAPLPVNSSIDGCTLTPGFGMTRR